ncbi:hypothetical protein QC764_113915 [Podospora pseudoanserina]|uniref:Uncharacterized protein n=1 Tax=Podospora pseudoanserina TaxID=2609844 RepID=A0ABR0IPN6_9PEZI|nr:hypothetical protein QC764_113915 [Podospora pseudoanserina]
MGNPEPLSIMTLLARHSPGSAALTSLIKHLRRSGIIDILISWRASTVYCIVSPISTLKTVPRNSAARLRNTVRRVYRSNRSKMAGPQTKPLPKGRQSYTARETTPMSTTTKGRMMDSRVMKRQSQTAMAKRQKVPVVASHRSPHPRHKNFEDFLTTKIFPDMYLGNFVNILQFSHQGVAAQGSSDSDPKTQLSSRRGNPCSFRTLLNDGASSCDSLSSSTFEELDSGDIRFDDSECISIGRTLGNVPNHQLQKRVDSGIVLETQGRNLYSVPTDLFALENEHGDETMGDYSCIEQDIDMAICSPIFTTQDHTFKRSFSANEFPAASNLSGVSESDKQVFGSMEAMNMPFSLNEPVLRRHKRFPFRDHDAAKDDEDDDMSIISDFSLIPSYTPGGIDQQYKVKVKVGRATFKRLLKIQAKVATKTVRHIKRSCREAMGQAFDHSSPVYKPATCVRVGGAC